MTLGFGGLASWAKNDYVRELLYFGWAGLGFSFLTIVLGAIAMSATSRWPGVLLILCVLVGALAGGTFVAIFMALVLVGGVLAALPGRRRLALDGRSWSGDTGRGVAAGDGSGGCLCLMFRARWRVVISGGLRWRVGWRNGLDGVAACRGLTWCSG